MVKAPPDLTKRDFEQIVTALIDRAQATSPLLWNSWFEGDLGKVLVDLIAWDSSVLGFIGDVQFKEVFPDTARLRESLLHYTRLHGYTVRRGVPAILRTQVLATRSVASPNVLRLRKGSRVNVSNGQVWEIAADYTIQPGKLFPSREAVKYGDITYRGGGSISPALVQLKQGEARAYLSDHSGDRLPTDLNFVGRVGQGMILKLSSQWIVSTFASSPDRSHSEFAVLSVGSLPGDKNQGSVLYLDRPWDQPDWLGKWSVDDRLVQVANAETFTETINLPDLEADRKNLVIAGSFFPVVEASTQSPRLSGQFASVLSGNFVGSGVTVAVNGVVWDETPSLLLESPDSRSFQVSFDENDAVSVRFGDGIRGSILPSGSLTLEYSVGGGKLGNLSPGGFNGIVQAWINGDPNDTVPVALTNPYTQGSGGMEREGLDSIKTNLFSFIRANDRAVTAEDFESLATGFTAGAGRVALAKASLRTNLVPREQNIVWVHVWAAGPNGSLVAPDLALKTQLSVFLNQRKMVSDEVVIVDGELTNVPIVLRYRYKDGVPDWSAKELVAGALAGVFKKQVPGKDLDLSGLYHIIREIPEIETASFDSPSRTVEAGASSLFSNVLVPGTPVKLGMAAARGDTSVIPTATSDFYAGQVVMIYEPNKDVTVGVIDQVGGGVVTLRSGVCLADYSTNAEVFTSDLSLVGWSRERPINLFVTFSSSLPAGVPNQSIKFLLDTFFQKSLKPGETLKKQALQDLIGTVNGVNQVVVNFDRPDSFHEEIQVGFDELVVVEKLILNGVVS